MKITCLGGVKEIGGNKILIEHNGTRIFLDFGRAMGKANCYYEEFIQVRSKSALLDLLKLGILPKVDGVYPKHLLDITAMPKDEDIELESKLPLDDAYDYWKNDSIIPYGSDKKIDAVFLSHAHFDHIQDISFIHKDIEIHSTETTKILAKAITDVSQSSVEHQFYEVNDKKKISIKSENYRTVFPGELEYKDDKEVKLIDDPKTGYTFTHETKTVQRNYITDSEGEVHGLRYKLIPVGHSIPGACSILITTSDDKRILYTGDIRFHGTNEPTLDDYINNIGENKIDVMICEGTRIESDTELTEEDGYRDILDEAKKTKGLLLVDFGWKDTTRFDTFVRVANDTGRTLVINVKIAYLLYELQHRMGTIAVITDLNDDAGKIYTTLKSRPEIETMFDVFKNIIDADRTYMQDDHQIEGWMFINFLSLVYYYRLYKLLLDNDLLKKYSPKDVLIHLSRVKKLKVQKEWITSEIPKKTRLINEKLKIHIT